MVNINGRSAAQVLNDYRNLFALKKDGSFKTSVSSTTGYLCADKTGLKSVTGFRASAKAVASGNEVRNRVMRTELLQAFTACHASRQFLEFVRLRLGLNERGTVDDGNIEECSKPLSRRTVKYLLESFKSGTCTIKDDAGRTATFKTFKLKTDGSDGGKETSVHGAKDWILNAYRKLPENVDSILTDDGKVHYDADELKSMKGILTSALQQAEFSPVTMTKWVMKTHERNQLPKDVQNDLADAKTDVAEYIREVVKKHFRGQVKGLNPLVARLLADQSFKNACTTFDAIAIASRIFDKLQAEDPESLKDKDPMVVLYKKLDLDKELGSSEKMNPDDISQEVAKALGKRFYANGNVLNSEQPDIQLKAFARSINDFASEKEIGRPAETSALEAVERFLPSVLKNSAAALPDPVTEENLQTCLKSVSAHAKRTAAVLVALLSNATDGSIVSRISKTEDLENLMQSVLDDSHVARVLSAPDEDAFKRGLGDLLKDANLTAHLNGVLETEKQRLDAEDARLAAQQTTAQVKSLLKDAFKNEPFICKEVDNAAWAENARHDAEVSKALVTRFRGLIKLRDNQRISQNTFERFVQESLVSPKFAKKMPNFVTDLFAAAAQIEPSKLAESLVAGDVDKGLDFALKLASKSLTVLSQAEHDEYLNDGEDRGCAVGVLLQAWADASPEEFSKVRETLTNGNPDLADAICGKIDQHMSDGEYERAPDIELAKGRAFKQTTCASLAKIFIVHISRTKGPDMGHLRM